MPSSSHTTNDFHTQTTYHTPVEADYDHFIEEVRTQEMKLIAQGQKQRWNWGW